MYGAYIKGRGWIKSFDRRKQKFICCRSAGDIHKEFLFKNKTFLSEIQKKYEKAFEDLEFEYRRIAKDQLIDKRVVPHKKRYFYREPFGLTSCDSGYYNKYCRWCELYIDSSEYEMDGICIHCAKAFYDKINVHYKKIDKDIKRSWERARILDEI